MERLIDKVDINKFSKGIIIVNGLDLQNGEYLYDFGIFTEEELIFALEKYMKDKLYLESVKLNSKLCNMVDEILEDEEFDEEYKIELGIK